MRKRSGGFDVVAVQMPVSLATERGKCKWLIISEMLVLRAALMRHVKLGMC